MLAIRRLTVLLLVAATFALSATPGRAGEVPHGQSLLWRIDRSGVAPSHLLGTIHISDPRVLALPTAVRQAFEAADSLTVELLQNDGELMVEVKKRLVIRSGRLLDEILGPALFMQVSQAAACYGVAPETVKSLQPWAMWMIFSTSPTETARLTAGALALDRYLEVDALARGTPVYALETIAEQIDAIAGFPVEVDIAILRTVDADCEANSGEFEKVTQFYLDGDLAAIYDWATVQMGAIDPGYAALLEARLIDFRNALMTERMIERLAEGNAFFAVGALHLPGDNGILQRLTDAGYTVSPVY